MPERIKPFRRPTQKWCTATAIRLLRIAAGETFRMDAAMTIDDAEVLLKAARILDGYGQELKSRAAKP